MLAELLAVIAHDGTAVGVRVTRSRSAQQTADLRVVLGDPAVVGPVRERRPKRCGGGVRRVGVVEVHPRENGWLAPRSQASVRSTTTPRGRASSPAAVSRDVVVVGRNPAVEPVAVVEHERGDERPGPVAAAAGRRERRGRRGETAHAVVRRPCWAGRRPTGSWRETAGWSGTGVSALANLTPSAASRSRLGSAPADHPCADVIGAHRVEGHEEEVEAAAERSAASGRIRTGRKRRRPNTRPTSATKPSPCAIGFRKDLCRGG